MDPFEEPNDPLDALARGDSGPFEAFVAIQTPLFLAYFRRLGARPADAEDLCQDVMLRLFRNASSYQGQGRIEAFAFRVARNAWIDHCRRASVQRSSPMSQWEDSASEPAALAREDEPFQSVVQQEGEAAVFAAIAELGEGHREAFRLGVVEGLPYAEVAIRLGIPVGTVKSRVYHAVTKLRARLSFGSESALGRNA